MAHEPETQETYSIRREEMVRRQLIEQGIRDPVVLAAFRNVAREEFVPLERHDDAYADRPVPIGINQTISQPYIVARMLECLRVTGTEKALDVGTGSGYVTALLAEMCREVFSIERIPDLAKSAEQRLKKLGYDNVKLRTGDGTLGWPEAAPFDIITVGAASPRVPASLQQQLAEKGRLIIPVGDRTAQDLILVERHGNEFTQRSVCPCVFVPLIGKEGW